MQQGNGKGEGPLWEMGRAKALDPKATIKSPLHTHIALLIEVDVRERVEAAATQRARDGPESTVLGVMAQQGGESGSPGDSQ